MADYSYWQNALSGTFGDVHEGDPQLGFYRTRRAGPFIACAIFEHDGKIVALVDGKQADPAEIWTYVCQHPVAEDWYHAKMRGEPWPDEDGAVTESLEVPATGHNSGVVDESEVLKGQIESASASLKDYAAIKDAEHLARAQATRSRLLELSGDADKKREAEKKPHLDAGRNIDAKWQPLVKAAKAAADTIKAAMDAWVNEQDKIAKKVQAAAEEAARKEQEAARAAVAAGKPAPPPTSAPEPIAAPAVPQQIKGGYGRAAGVKTVNVVTVTDQDAAYQSMKTHPELVALIAKLAQRGIDAGHDINGVNVEKQKKVG